MERFWKLNALGNHFVFTIHDAGIDYPALARRACAAATGIGADGLLTVDLETSPPMVRMWNPDGTTDFCGNGLCCAAHLLRFLGRDHVEALDTPIRSVPVRVDRESRATSRVAVGMERGTFDPGLVPLATEHATIEQSGYTITVAGTTVRLYPVNNGNMHSIILVDELPSDEIFSRLGPLIENHPLFPYRTNVLWCRLDRAEVRMRIWERGVGETLSCGTGSAAVFSVCERLGLLIDSSLAVVTSGGIAEVNAENDKLFLTTRVTLTFEGIMISKL